MRPGARVVLTTIAVVVFAISCSQQLGRQRAPNVVLIVVDTLRADHLGCYGYPRPTSPNIDAFASRATRYTRAISAGAWTVPSHASLFTGKPPFAHGAHTVHVDVPTNNVNPLAEAEVTLAEALLQSGYRTGAFVANAAYLAQEWNLDQGFESWTVARVYADELNPLVLPWLDAAAETRDPFFLFVNYIDVHGPYDTRPRPGIAEEAVSRDPKLMHDLARRVLPANEPVPAALARRVIDQYDTAIANADAGVGALLDRIESLGLGEDTVVVVTSDHGEYFGEHHLAAHSKDVYQEVLRVPLLIRAPGQTAGRLDDRLTVSNDVPGLIAAEFPADARDRLRALFPELPGNHVVVSENYYTRLKDLFHPLWGHRFQRVRRAVFEWPHKVIVSSDGHHELYDLEADPAESENLIDRKPQLVERLTADLRSYEAARGRREPQRNAADAQIEGPLRENLEALGYIEE